MRGFECAKSLNECSKLTYKIVKGSNGSSQYVFIVRGDCSFEKKVRNVQKAGNLDYLYIKGHPTTLVAVSFGLVVYWELELMLLARLGPNPSPNGFDFTSLHANFL
ncbi:hypothetical protein ACFE04_021135 [Oxalis oulophora]